LIFKVVRELLVDCLFKRLIIQIGSLLNDQCKLVKPIVEFGISLVPQLQSLSNQLFIRQISELLVCVELGHSRHCYYLG